jgi:hypothetical protein
VRIVIVAVDVTAVANVTLQAMDGEVQTTKAAGFVGLFNAVNGELGGGVLLMLRHEPRRLHEHAARTARRIEDAAVVGLDHLGEQADDAARRVELATLLAFGAGELAKKVFVDTAEGVVIHAGRNLGDLLEQFLEQRAGEEVVGLGQHAGELRIVFLDVPHGGVDLTADVFGLGPVQQVVEACLGGQVEDALGVVGGWLVHATATSGGCPYLLQLDALGGEADFCEAQEDQAEDRRGILLGLEPGVGTELVSGIPEPFFERRGGSVFSARCNPAHKIRPPRA